MPKTLAERTDYRETSAGMEIEIVWSQDETMVKLAISNSGNAKSSKTVHLASLELDDLRMFLNSRVQQ